MYYSGKANIGLMCVHNKFTFPKFMEDQHTLHNLCYLIPNVSYRIQRCKHIFLCNTYFNIPKSTLFLHYVIDTFLQTDAFWSNCSRWLLKTLWHKEKLLIMTTDWEVHLVGVAICSQGILVYITKYHKDIFYKYIGMQEIII